MPKLVYDVVFNFDDTQTSTVGDKVSKGVNKAKQSADNLNKEMSLIKPNTERAKKALFDFAIGADTALERATNSTKDFGEAQRRTRRQIDKSAKGFASANQLVFSFSDGIQDATQFSQGFGQGMRAIGNNISFTAELLGVTAKNAKDAGVSMRTALASAISPVTAGILALNVALTVGQFIWNEWGKEAKESANLAEDAVKSFVSESAKIESQGGFDFLGIRSLREQIDVMQGLNSEVTDLLDNQQALDAMKIEFLDFFVETPGETFLKVLNVANGRFDDQVRLIEDLEQRYNLTTEQAQNFADQLKAANNELAILEGLQRNNPLADLMVRISERTTEWTSDFNAGLIEGTDRAENLTGFLRRNISGLQAGDANVISSLRLEEDQVRPAILFLQGELEKLNKLAPEKPTVPIQLPDDTAIDTSGELMLDLMSIGADVSDEFTDLFQTQMNEDMLTQFTEFAEEEHKEMERVIDDQSKQGLQERLDDLRTYENAFKRNAEERKRVEKAVTDTKVSLQHSASRAITSIQSGLLGENKALALGLLAIEKGLAISEVVISGAKNAAVASAYGAKMASQSLTPFGVNPTATAAAANAYAKAAKIKAMTAANVALIAATGLGEAAGILSGGGSSGGGGAGSASTGGQNPFIRREGEVEPPQFDPRRSRDGRDTTFVIEQRIENDKLAILVRKGNKKIEEQIRRV